MAINFWQIYVLNFQELISVDIWCEGDYTNVGIVSFQRQTG